VRDFLRTLITTALFFVVIAAVLRAVAFDVWVIPGDDALFAASLAPTLSPGDLVLLYRRGAPGFGDLVRCEDPQSPENFVVGRILGEPGDRIDTDGTVVRVNGHPARTAHSCDRSQVMVNDPTTGSPVELHCEWEELGSVTYMRARHMADARATKTTTDVDTGNVYIMSDDRYYHDDSRDFGALPRTSCTERIIFRFWSKDGWFDESNRLTLVH
jgi:signal peptidase I